MSFVHLHTHTAYSLLDGSNKIKDYVKKVKDSGMNACAITDHGVMYGVIEFYEEAKKNGINPILGCEVYVSPGSRFDREQGAGEDKYHHLILLAENNTGYANLVKIVSIGFQEGFYRKPRVDFETLEKYHEGLICLSACVQGIVPRLIQREQYEEAKAMALKYRDLFGENNYFLELQDHGLPVQKQVNQGLLRIHKDTGIPLVATNDCHYTEADHAEAHDILLCVQTGKKVQDTDRLRYEGGQYYVKTEEEMRSLFPYAPEALENTQKIADRCRVEIEFGVTKVPHFDVPEGYDSWTYLNKLCNDGLVERYGDQAEKYRSRLDYELSTIRSMGYVDYFLIVWDFIHFARERDIPVGPGRGSAAGSLVSYTTHITNIDPMRYDLIFERFLNPERVSMPDIDVDFSYERRGEVIEYVVQKYGSDCVSQIITFGTMAAKNAIRDVGRVMDLPYAYVDTIAKGIPARLPDVGTVTIDLALEANAELRTMYETDDTAHKLIDMAKKLEGLPRNASMHAAGVIICGQPVTDFVPLSRVMAQGPLVTQFEKNTVERLGLLKMDFLGLRTLTVIDDAVKMIRQNYGIHIDIDHIDFNDKEMYEEISAGHTAGIFQLESGGMTTFMKELKPENIEDIIAGISLYRPGPMDFIPRYLEGRKNRDAIHYETPELEPILKNTFGCMVYQEQVMQIVRDLAGYSMGRSDLVRRAMSKKKTDVMEKERRNFVYGNPEEGVEGCVAKGISEAVANHIYDEMIDFGKYAFNKSHAAGYAVVALQTAYLKTHYPKEFYAAIMSSFLEQTAKIAGYIQVCRSNGYALLPPDVNEGAGPFVATEEGIRYGMYAIRSVGKALVDSIVEERKRGGEYKSLEDFLRRNNGTTLNKRAVENLIKAGALDSLEGNRRQKMQIYPTMMDSISSHKKNDIEGQISFFDMVDEDAKKDFEISFPDVEEYEKDVKLAFEKEVLGVYVSGHPLEDDADLMKVNVTATSAEFALSEDSDDEAMAAAAGDSGEDVLKASIEDKKDVVIGGLLIEKKIHFTKRGSAMAFLTIEDLYGTVEVVVFSREFEKAKPFLQEDAKLLIYGQSSVEENKDAKVLATEIVPFSRVPKRLWLRFSDAEDFEEKKLQVEEIMARYAGEIPVSFYIKDTKEIIRGSAGLGVTDNPEMILKLSEVLGEGSAVLSPVKYPFRKRFR